MNQETLVVANSLGLWLACCPIILVMLIQVFVFMKKAWNVGPKIGVSQEQMIRALRSSAITSIGPAVAVLVALVELITQ